MIITLHNNKVHWKHAQPLVSLIDHMVYIFDKEFDTPTIGVVKEITDDGLVINEEEDDEDALTLIPFDDIERIHYP